MSPRREALRAFLRSCDVAPDVLARDPSGASWLPESLRSWALADPGAQEEIRRFVAAESCLFEAPAGADDGAFVAAVARRLRTIQRPERRTNLRATVVFAAYLASVVCLSFVASWAVPGFAGAALSAADGAVEGAAAWAEDLWAGQSAVPVGWPLGLLVLVVAGGGLAVARRGRLAHTSRA